MAELNATQHAEPARLKSSAPFFGGMSCKYSIDPGATADAMLSDAYCLLAGGLGILESIGDSLGGENLHAGNAYGTAVYAITQAADLVMAVQRLSSGTADARGAT